VASRVGKKKRGLAEKINSASVRSLNAAEAAQTACTGRNVTRSKRGKKAVDIKTSSNYLTGEFVIEDSKK